MSERLWARWRETVRAARASAPEPICEQSGWVVALHVLGLLPDASPEERQTVRKALARALPECDPDLRPVAEAALRLLGHGREGKLPRDLRRPTARRLTGLLRAELDPVAAAYCAGWLSRHPTEAELLRALARAEGATAPRRIAVAAASASRMRDPSEGHLVATQDTPAAQAVWFADAGELAIYAQDAVPVRVEAEGVTTCEIAPGYWIGQVADGLRSVTATVYVGDETFEWPLVLP